MRRRPLRGRAARLPAAACLVTGLAACQVPASEADRAELANLAPWNVTPKSSPAQLVKGFRAFCVEGPRDPAARESALRDAGYVPTRGPGRARARVFLVDDRRPAIALGPRSCMAQARARTGQAEAVNDYVAATFPDARPADPAAFGPRIERAWRVGGRAVVATERRSTLDRRNGYAVIHFAPD